MSSLESVYLDLLPISTRLVFVVVNELYECFIYFQYCFFIIYIICKYLLPFLRLPFHFVDYAFTEQKLFSLIQSQVFVFGVVSFAF